MVCSTTAPGEPVWEGRYLIKRFRLPVIQTVMDAFTFAFRKFPSLFALTLVASVIIEPLMFLVLQVTGSFAEFSLFAQSGLSTDYPN